jgi:hypothetical protein
VLLLGNWSAPPIPLSGAICFDHGRAIFTVAPTAPIPFLGVIRINYSRTIIAMALTPPIPTLITIGSYDRWSIFAV